MELNETGSEEAVTRLHTKGARQLLKVSSNFHRMFTLTDKNIEFSTGNTHSCMFSYNIAIIDFCYNSFMGIITFL